MDSSKINKLIENIDLNVNSWLINWGLMRGEYHERAIRSTKFGLINQLFTFWLFVYTIIKWTTLIFHPIESQLSIYLGEWAHWFGPKIIVDVILVFQPMNSLFLVWLFFVGSKNPKRMLYWLDLMEFDDENRCFRNLNLNKIDSKRFIKQFAILRLMFKILVNSCVFITLITQVVSFFLFKNEHHLYYFISFVTFAIEEWYFVNHWFSLIMVLYQV